MASSFEFEAEARSANGSGAARALRRQGKVPAVIYGGSSDPLMVSMNHKDLVKNLENEAVYSHILDVKVGGKIEKAVLKDIQRHPSRPFIVHVDFLRVSANEKLKVSVPLHFVGEDKCAGVKAGGVLTHELVDVEVSCLPKDLPEYLVVDVSALEVGHSVHLSDVQLPAGVEVLALQQGEDHNLPVAALKATRSAVEDDEEAAVEEDSSDS